MADWQSRLRPEIVLTAPDGSQFTAFWLGDSIEAQKRVARFDYPEKQGTEVQDLGSAGLGYPLTLHFEGATHDVDAMRFVNALCAQAGSWTVVHPVYGTKILQPLSATLAADPTGSGNISRVETQWLEPGPAAAVAPPGALQQAATPGAVLGLATELDAGAVEQFTSLADIADPSAAAALASSGVNLTAYVQESQLPSLASRVAEVRATFDNAYTTTVNAFMAAPMDLVAAASGIQQLLDLPASIESDLSARLNAFAGMIESVVDGFLPDGTAEGRQAAVVTELVLTGCLTGMAKSVATATPRSREEALQGILGMQAAFDSVTGALDGAQAAGSGYVSHSQTYGLLGQLMAQVQALLLRMLFDLKIAKRFTLDRPRAPIEIAITEYGGLGPRDENLDLFIVTNGLLGQDLLLLPAGRQVVVYV